MKLIFCDNGMRAVLNYRGDVVRHFATVGHEVIIVYPACTHEEERMGSVPEGVRIIQVDVNPTGSNPLGEIRYFLELLRIYHREKPDHIFHYTIKPNIYGTLAARLCGLRNTAMVAGLGYAFVTPGVKAYLMRLLYRFALRRADYCLTLNSSIYSLLLEKGFLKKDRSMLLEGGEGVNLEDFPQLEYDGCSVGFNLISRVLADKGYREYVYAAKEVRKKFPDVKFEIIGPSDPDSPMGISLEEIKKDVESGAVEYLGYTLDVRPFISRPGTVVVLPSWHEGLSRILMEACSMGVPILASDIPGCRETVDDGLNGFLFPAKDEEALVGACLKYLSLSPAERGKMADESRRKAEREFSVDKVISVYYSILER